MSADEKPRIRRLPPVDRRRRRPAPFNQRPALAGLGEAPEWRGYPPGPVHPPGLFPDPDPAPVPGCGRCAQLADDRTAARAAGDYSAVSDANVLIRRHPGH
ncbi:hypothetical protein [Streptomyces sp. MAR4 CNX-425]|uniref:hypothetical protein n=1 Tax=Streptomyces sp. MAR4 CNX-425 TaxID=3406343 RepID=UPI003B50ECCC